MDKHAAVEDPTLMMLHLTSFSEKTSDFLIRKAWKGYDFDTLDDLDDQGYLFGSNRSKSVTLTDEGIQRAEELLEQYGITLDSPSDEVPSFRFHLAFNFEELSCSRDLLVPKHTSFEDFHTMIQACLNWMNYHLYNFELVSHGEPQYIAHPHYETGEDPRADFLFYDEDEPKSIWRDSTKTYLDDFFPATRTTLYSYDYGDGWEITIELLNQGEKIHQDRPICWSGNGDAPPEDVGGEGGFAHFLRVRDDESDEEHDHLAAWGENQGFERFVPRRANNRLARWSDWKQIAE
ncbi:DUF6429 family protein [Gordonibacter sp.]|uniref:DUF6429 family protein n=1 Tax=Gordonibacter sp. TaxID=1968902 RepID=UPI002FC64D01